MSGLEPSALSKAREKAILALLSVCFALAAFLLFVMAKPASIKLTSPCLIRDLFPLVGLAPSRCIFSRALFRPNLALTVLWKLSIKSLRSSWLLNSKSRTPALCCTWRMYLMSFLPTPSLNFNFFSDIISESIINCSSPLPSDSYLLTVSQ